MFPHLFWEGNTELCAETQMEVQLSFPNTNAIKCTDFPLFNKAIRFGDASLINWLQLMGLPLYNADLSLQYYTYL